MMTTAYLLNAKVTLTLFLFVADHHCLSELMFSLKLRWALSANLSV